MDYINSMKRLEQYGKNKRELGHKASGAYNIAKRAEEYRTLAGSINAKNLVERTKSILRISSRDQLPYLNESIKSDCEFVGIEYSGKIKTATETYERRLLDINKKAEAEMEKGMQKPLAQSGAKLFAVIFLSIFGAAMLLSALAVGSMGGVGESASGVCSVLGMACIAGVIFILAHKKKPDEAELEALAEEAKRLTNSYFSSVSGVLEKGAATLEERYNSLIEAETEKIKAEIGERVFLLFENTPYRQQDYFIRLGMTATAEEDFNSIAQECLKAEKAQEQIDVQNMINIETRNSINQGIEKLNRTAKQMHEDAEFRARQQAEQNAQMIKQNDRNYKAQTKTVEEIKKQNKLAEEMEYRNRQRFDK